MRRILRLWWILPRLLRAIILIGMAAAISFRPGGYETTSSATLTLAGLGILCQLFLFAESRHRRSKGSK